VLRVDGQPVYIGFVYSSFFGALIAYALLRTTLVSSEGETALVVGPAAGGWLSFVFVLIALAVAIWASKRTGVIGRKLPVSKFATSGGLTLILLHDVSANFNPPESAYTIILVVILGIIMMEYNLREYYWADYSLNILPSMTIVPLVFVSIFVMLFGVLAVAEPSATTGQSVQMVMGSLHFGIQPGGFGSLPSFPMHARDDVPSMIDVALELTMMTWVLSVYSSCFVPDRIYAYMNPDQADVPEVVTSAHEATGNDISIDQGDFEEISKTLQMVDAALAPGVWAPAEIQSQLVQFRRRARAKLDEVNAARFREQAHTIIKQIVEVDSRVNDVDDLEQSTNIQHRLEELRTELSEFSTKSEGMGPEIEYEIAGAYHLIERIDGKITEATLRMLNEESSFSDDPVTVLRAVVDVLGPYAGEGADRSEPTTFSIESFQDMYRTIITEVLENMEVTTERPSTDMQTTLDLVETAMQHHRQLAGAKSHTQLEAMYAARVTALGANQAVWLADQGRWDRFEKELARVREAYKSIRGDLDRQFDADDELTRGLDQAVFGAIKRDYDRLHPAPGGADIDSIELDERVADALPFDVEATEGLPSRGGYRFPTRVDETLEAVDVVVPIFDRLDRTIITTFEDVMDRWERVSDHPSIRPLLSRGTVPYPWFVTRHALSENQAPSISRLEAQVRVMDQVINAVARAHRVDIPHGAIDMQAISFDTDSISSVQLGGWGIDRIREDRTWIHTEPEQAKAEDVRDLCNLWGELRADSESPGDAAVSVHAADDAIGAFADTVEEAKLDDGLDELRSLLPRP